MQLFELEPDVSEITEQAESEQVPVRRPTNVSEKHPGRQELPANSSHRAGYALHARSAHVQTLLQRNCGHRLRGEFPTGRGTGEVLRTGHETSEAGLPL